MYNGIGLATPRGSGTNGHVQRNFAIVRKREKINNKDDPKSDNANRQPNKEILDHAKRRKLELKCIEYADILEEQGFTQSEIISKLETYRTMLQLNDKEREAKQCRDVVQETHHIAEANLQKNSLLREAFGISEHFVDGTSFDPERREREAQMKAMVEKNKNYQLVRTPSPVTETVNDLEMATKDKDSTHKKKKNKDKKSKKESEKLKKKKKDKKRKKSDSSLTNDSCDSLSDNDSSEDEKLKNKRTAEKKRSNSVSKVKKSKKEKRERSKSPQKSRKLDKSKKKNKDKTRKARQTSSESDLSDDSDASSVSGNVEPRLKRRKRSKRSQERKSKKHSLVKSASPNHSNKKTIHKKTDMKKHKSRNSSSESEKESELSKISKDDFDIKPKNSKIHNETSDNSYNRDNMKRNTAKDFFDEEIVTSKTLDKSDQINRQSKLEKSKTLKDSWKIENNKVVYVNKYKKTRNSSPSGEEFDIERRSRSADRDNRNLSRSRSRSIEKNFKYTQKRSLGLKD